MANDQALLERTRASAASPAEGVAAIPSQRELAIKTFGVLNAGEQSKGSVITSLVRDPACDWINCSSLAPSMTPS